MTISKLKVTSSVTYKKEADATKRTKKTNKNIKFVSTKKTTLELTEKYDDEAAATTNQQIATISVKYSPTKVGYKGMKWKAKSSKIVYVSPYGVVTPLKKGSTKIYGYTKDGTNKKVTLNVKVKAAPITATPTPLLEEDTRIATTVENFESYAVGTDWTKTSGYTAGGFANSGSMTVVQDPENPKNKVLKVDFTGKDQAFDFAPVFHLNLGSKTLGDYNGLRFKSRVISNSSDCNYKTVATYFDTYNSIKPTDYFDTSNNTESSAKKASDAKNRFGVNVSMATGVDKNYNVPDKVTPGLAIQDKDIIAASPGKKYNNKVFPTYYQDYSPPKNDKTAVSPGYSEEETNASNKVGFQQNTLDFKQERINDAWISGTDTTPLLQRSKVDMVFGSTYTGSQGRDWGAWHLILYIDDIQLMSGDIACTKMEFVNPIKKLACGNPEKGTTGATAQMQLSYTPANTTQKEVTYTSSDESLAKVDSKGLVTANSDKKEGVVTITATNKANGSIVAKTNITIESVEPATADYNVLTESSTKLVPKGEVSATNKVASNVTDLTIAGGQMKMKFTQQNKEHYVLDLGKDINLNRYKGVEIAGVAPGQVTMEFYNSDFDMNYTKDNGKDNDWYDAPMTAGKTYPFYVGSCGWRYEAGGMNYLKAWENGYKDPADQNNKEAAAPSPETLKYSLQTLGKGCNGDWSSIRYIVFKAAQAPQLQSPYRFKTGSTFEYTITSLKFIVDEFMEAKDAGHYIVYNKDAEDSYKNSIAETSGNTTAYYVDNISDTNTVEKHDSTMNLSDMKYIKVKVKDTDKVNVGLIADGKKIADTVVIGQETGSGDRSVYVSLKDISAGTVDLTKIDAISVETAAGGSVESVSLTMGEISFAKKDPETKVEVKGSTVTPVTEEAYGSEG